MEHIHAVALKGSGGSGRADDEVELVLARPTDKGEPAIPILPFGVATWKGTGAAV
jgi:hypothetical protein